MSPAFLYRRLRAAAALLSAASLCSCLDIEQNLVLNPDGSGKVTMTTAMAVPGLDGLSGLGGGSGDEGGKKLKPREQAREIAVSMLRAEGIEAWSDVTYGVGKDGKTRASVTGYFPDATKVRVASPFDNSGEKEDLGVSKNADGNWVIEDDLNDKKDKNGAKDQPAEQDGETAKDPATLTAEEIQDKLDEERQQWAAMKGFMSAFFDGLRISMTVQGGGTIVDTAVFEKKDDHTAALEFTGKKLMAGVDALLQDDEKAKDLIKKGVSPSGGGSGPNDFFKMMFGGDGKMRVTLKPGEPAFDYAAAVAKAKAAVTPELRALLEDAKKPAKSTGLPGLSLPGLDGGDAEPPKADTDEPKRGTPGRKPRRID